MGITFENAIKAVNESVRTPLVGETGMREDLLTAVGASREDEPEP